MSQEPFGDIPLFRELQKLLSAGGGPVNLEIARQVANAIGAQSGADRPPGPEVERTIAETVHAAEGLLAGYGRLTLVEPMRTEAITRAGWVTATLQGWRWLFEQLASRFAGELGRLAAEESEGQETPPMQAAMGQVAPLLFGIQAGTLIGHLAREQLARYDLPIPRDDNGRLFFVVSNIDRMAGDYDLEVDSLRRFIALHEASRHLIVTAVPWVGRYARSLLNGVIESIELDTSDLESMLMELQTRGIEGIQEDGAPQNMLPVVQTERHRLALDRLRAWHALFEGYARHCAAAVSDELGPFDPRVAEAVTRRESSPSEGEQMLGAVLGVSLDRELEAAGATFCAAVVKLHGINELNKVWDAPDNLPTFAEIRDPFAWMERVLPDPGPSERDG